MAFHVLNRGVRRAQLFDQSGDYAAFMQSLVEAHERFPIRIFAYCLMPNHFHLVASPLEDGQLSQFMRLMTVTHSKRWHAFRRSAGTGHVYQGRFKAIPVQADGHFLTVCRYVERNARSGKLVRRAEDWPWCSLAQRCRNDNLPTLAEWPIPRPRSWVNWVNGIDWDLQAVQDAVRKGRPFGDQEWMDTTSEHLHLRHTLCNPGRPRNDTGSLFAE
jgi:REP-associated tyrosine transposase